MGQTLEHGIYLPDEGERNCYDGLAANWQLLDGAVGTVAEHTTALAGKAPAVHTHTKADITDFPAYGNAAGTICEGNDSRLSDARTPVAHTHTKSDVTDLFNSANVWTDTNTFSNTLKQVNSAITKGTIPQSDTTAFNVYWGGTGVSNLTNGLFVQRGIVYADGSTAYILYALENVSGGTHTSLSLRYNPNDTINPRHAFMRGDFRPYYDNSFNLGIPTHRWKTLNGVNPGALSFPEGTTSNANTTFNPDLTDWLTDGTGFTITAQVTGWLHIRIQNSTGNFAWVKRASAGNNQTWGIVGNSDTNSDIADMPLNVPVVQGYVYTLKLKTSRLSAAIFMCLGNV